jgi:alpha-glucosidase
MYYKEGKEKSLVYEDAQDGYDYKKGRFSLLSFQSTGKAKELIVQLHKDGKFDTTYTKYRINVIGLPFKVKKIEVDNVEVAFDKKAFEKDKFLVVDKEFTELHFIGL